MLVLCVANRKIVTVLQLQIISRRYFMYPSFNIFPVFPVLQEQGVAILCPGQSLVQVMTNFSCYGAICAPRDSLSHKEVKRHLAVRLDSNDWTCWICCFCPLERYFYLEKKRRELTEFRILIFKITLVCEPEKFSVKDTDF